MANEIKSWTSRAFGAIHPENPLNRLKESDRRVLWAMLMMYRLSSKREGRRKALDDGLERLSRIMEDAARLGVELQSEVFEGPFSAALYLYTCGFEDIPLRLIDFSRRLGPTLDGFGKTGHKGKHLATQLLVQASEFVLLKTGEHYDEHLSELFQAIGNPPESEEFSGDAIRKKRENLKKKYPGLYVNAVKWAKREFAS